jgi:hypothetical protein
MGLDMYINRVNRTNHSVEELVEFYHERDDVTPESQDCQPFLPLRKFDWGDAYCIFHEACYWRKFNALHNWFVNNLQNGVDDCGFYELTQEKVNECLDVLREVKDTKKYKLMEPKSGFFFGSTEVDEWYWDGVDNAIDQLEKLLNLDWNAYRFFYHSSW